MTPLSDPIIEVLRLRVSEGARAARAFVNTFMESPQAKAFLEHPHGGPGVFVVDAGQPLQGLQAFGFDAAQRLEDALALEHGDALVTQARPRAPFAGGSTVLGNLRLALHQAAVAQGLLPAPEGFDFLWVTDFPLFSPATEAEPGQGGTAGLCSTHHPFTSPRSAHDVDLLSTAPTQAKADHYDLVLNGVELGGGSRRIHDARMQAFVLREVLKVRVRHAPARGNTGRCKTLMPLDRRKDAARTVRRVLTPPGSSAGGLSPPCRDRAGL